jgi:hypothetical protein
LQSYVGTYESDGQDRLRITVTLEREQLYVQVGGQDATPMFAHSETKSFPKGVTNRWVEFVPGGNQKEMRIVITQSGREFRARRP